MAPTGGKSGGVSASLRRIIDSLLALGQNRLQLFAAELQSEKLRWFDTLLKLGLAVAVAMIGLMLAAVTLVMFVWEKARYSGLLVVTGVFLVAGGVLLWRLRDELRREPLPFEKTAAEFKKDRECFTDKN